ncbi:MAG: DUF4159 domain-containing protein [Gemmobacter sp.]
MWTIGPLGFTAPFLLIALVALPILWLILRAVPPAPIRRRFPGVALLLGLTDDETETDKTPWWLLLLRMAAIGAAILAFAGPILNPQARDAGTGPLLILADATWADARDWPRRAGRMAQLVEEAGRDGRPVAVLPLTDAPTAQAFQTAAVWAPRLTAIEPRPWAPYYPGWANALPEGDFATAWLSDGIDHAGRAGLLAALEQRGPVTVYDAPRVTLALRPARFEDGAVQVTALRLPAGDETQLELSARGPDPAGIERELARVPLTFAAGASEAEVAISLPPEIRNRLTRFELAGIRSAAAVSLTDDSLKRRKVALISGQAGDAEGLQLLSPTHYLRQALDPVAELIDGTLGDVILASPDVIVLADVARLAQAEQDAMLDWLDKGGLLLRFAGPRLAASDVSRSTEDPLLPVRLREGGRTVGGAMSWGEPKALAPFREGTAFFGLTVPPDAQVTAQVLAQPDPTLAERTIATLADGTPLVTRKPVGQGQVVLFHVTANAEWSTLPLSGLFVQMLERLAVSTRPLSPEAGDLAGTTWTPQVMLDARGALRDAGDRAGVAGEALAQALATGPGADLPPGLYAGDDRRIALNVFGPDTPLAAAEWPARIPREGVEATPERSLKGALLAAALALLMVDVLAALAVSGRLVRGMGRASVIVLALLLAPAQTRAQDSDPAADRAAIEATTSVRLGYVVTGNAQVDRISEAGLRGLGLRLYERTTIEPEAPIAVNIETDELAFFPFLYWPVTADLPAPSGAAYAKLNRYLRTGGMILFDTRDGDISASGTTPEARRLQAIAAPLDIPPLEILPEDHVLTRTFYLLQDFPGRYNSQALWVEAAPADAQAADGMPFRNLNDGVTPVVLGSNDWAAAWAVDDRGAAMFPVGRGFAGERQRETAVRFGINLIMHVLTGNYKSDQVHVPALLERLGN